MRVILQSLIICVFKIPSVLILRSRKWLCMLSNNDDSLDTLGIFMFKHENNHKHTIKKKYRTLQISSVYFYSFQSPFNQED